MVKMHLIEKIKLIIILIKQNKLNMKTQSTNLMKPLIGLKSNLREKTFAVLFLCLSVLLFSNAFAQYTLSSDEEWGPLNTPVPPSAENGIVIGSHKLIIHNSSLSMNSATVITLGSGGELVLDGVTLNSSATWIGIQATGSGGEQFTTFPTEATGSTTTWAGVLDPNQTAVLITGGLIENAEIAAKSTAGAIIRARNVTFNNCERGIKVETYHSVLDANMNACFAMGCFFLWNQILSGFSSTDFIGIDLAGVTGVNIGGCKFENSDPSSYCHFDRGIGINSLEADFEISEDGNQLCADGFGCLFNCGATSNPNEFIGLSNGIKAIGHITNKNLNVVIKKVDFSNILFSILITNSEASVITDCNFLSVRTGPVPLSTPIGMNNLYTTHTTLNGCDYVPTTTVIKYIETIDSKKVKIKDSEISADDINVSYITLDNTGSSLSFIKKTEFNNTKSGGILSSNAVHAIHLKNANTGLQIRCNDFSNMSRDIFTASGSTLGDQKQGSGGSATPFGNSFSANTPGAVINIFNDATAGYEIHDPNASTLLSTGGGNPGVITLVDNLNTPICTDQGCKDLAVTQLTYKQLQFYPNPFQNEIHFENTEYLSPNIEVHIYNSMGQLIKTTTIGESHTINLDNISQGLIYIRVMLEPAIYQQKLIKL